MQLEGAKLGAFQRRMGRTQWAAARFLRLERPFFFRTKIMNENCGQRRDEGQERDSNIFSDAKCQVLPILSKNWTFGFGFTRMTISFNFYISKQLTTNNLFFSRLANQCCEYISGKKDKISFKLIAEHSHKIYLIFDLFTNSCRRL
jgi:hypothetical protein